MKTKNNLIVKILLSFAILFSGVSILNATSNDPDDNLVLDKQATYNPDTDEVEYVLEAYAKGEIKTTTVAKPTDIIMVLDQSGSMDYIFDAPHKRVDSLKNAVGNFINTTRNHAITHDVDHRISILGFASGSRDNYAGTEILSTPHGNTIRYGSNHRNNLAASLLNVVTQTNRLELARDRISAVGWTHTNLGVEMANDLLGIIGNTADRNRVVIIFTDGEPNGDGSSGNVTFTLAANAALQQANKIKDRNVPIYTVAIYPDADPAHNSTNMNWNFTTPVQKVNRFLHYMSSNYGKVTNITTPLELNNAGKYLVANTPQELNNIFDTISQEIGQPAIDLDANTVLLDYVVDDFVVDSNTVVKTYTRDYLGNGTWDSEVEFNGLVDIVNNRVSVSGFDYGDNFVLDGDGNVDTQGKKLIVKFSAKPIDGYLGGNQIETNVNTSGIYKGDTMIKPFDIPKVDIDKNAEFVVNDVNIHLTNTLDPKDLLSDLGVLKYSQAGNLYTFDGHRNKHMNVYITLRNANGDVVYTGEVLAGQTDLVGSFIGSMDFALEADEKFTADFSLKPKASGTVVAKNTNKVANAYVYMPVVKVSDKTLYRGEAFAGIDGEMNGWKHNTTVVDTVDTSYPVPTVTFGMSFVDGSDPAGALIYYPEFTSRFKLHVLLDHIDKTSLTDITTDTYPGDFMINVLVKKIKIVKQLDKLRDDGQSFIFNVKWEKPDHLVHFADYETEVVIVGANTMIVGDLPIGAVSVTEDEVWSWRYEHVGDNPVELTLEANEDVLEAVFNNRLVDDKWLTDEVIETNIFKDSVR